MIRLIPFIESGYNLPRYWRRTGGIEEAKSDPGSLRLGLMIALGTLS
jgi:hypothetical protein